MTAPGDIEDWPNGKFMTESRNNYLMNRGNQVKAEMVYSFGLRKLSMSRQLTANHCNASGSVRRRGQGECFQRKRMDGK